MDVNHTFSKWLILGFLRSPDVMEEAFSKLSFKDFKESENPLRVAYLIGSKWFKQSKSAVPYDVVVSEFEHSILRNNLISEADAVAFGEHLQWAYSLASEIKDVKDYILDELKKLLITRKILPVIEQLPKSDDLLEGIGRLNQEVAKSSICKTGAVDPFAKDDPMLVDNKRKPWGVDFVDVVTSGGSSPGETTLLLAPSGGGKTLTNVQMATTAALNGEDAMIISYEQSIVPGITNRIYSYALGIPIASLNDMNVSKFKDNRAMVQKWSDIKSRLKGKLHLFDMLEAARNNKGGGGGPSEIAKMIKQVLDRGANLRYVGIDWLGPMVNNYMAARNINQNDITKVMNDCADQIRKIGTDYGVNIFIYHQLGTQAAQAGARRKPEATDAFQCRTLHHYMDTVICIGNRDPESNLAWITAPKVRNGQPFMDMTIQMEGALSRWKYVDKANVNTESMKVYDQDSISEAGSSTLFDKRPRRVVSAAEFSSAVRENLG